MRTVQLNRGTFTLVSDEDYDLVSRFKWSVSGGSGARRYAARNNAGRTEYLHRFLVSPPPHAVVDHVDGDSLNNTRENLRIGTQSQNLGNQRAKGVFKGVTRKRGHWAAHLSPRNSHRRNLGTFLTPEDAAIAYDIAAREYFGEFALTNFPDVRPRPPTLRERLIASPPACAHCGDAVVVSPIGIVRKYCNSRCSNAARGPR